LILVPWDKLNTLKNTAKTLSNRFYKDVNANLSRDEIIATLFGYVETDCLIGSSSNGSTSPNHHWTYHKVSEFYKNADLFPELVYKSEHVMNSIFIGYSEPGSILQFMFYPTPIRCNTLHCFDLSATVLHEEKFLEEYAKANKINYLFTIASHLFLKNNFNSLEICHIRAIGDSNDIGIKKQIENGCKYVNIMSSSENLLQMLSVVEKTNMNEFGLFNVIKRNYELDKVTGELVLRENGKNIKTGDCFENVNNKLKFLGRTKAILPDSIKAKEMAYDKV
jgi:hypothetical protein